MPIVSVVVVVMASAVIVVVTVMILVMAVIVVIGRLDFRERVPDFSVVDIALLKRCPLHLPLRIIRVTIAFRAFNIDNTDIAIMRVGAIGVQRAPVVTVLEFIQ